uniref:Uncharacterized protein n=1 Tax=Solanum lycopersicum TaxID=4081 RepID=A0A3Q7F4B4_SOLLC
MVSNRSDARSSSNVSHQPPPAKKTQPTTIGKHSERRIWIRADLYRSVRGILLFI